ncbi:hypothetical protein DFR52_103785 [Hoeflea marina]|uniref:SnoaL-like protein n=1 Tax=Hoeflea marina TaxID=274592 RepID=A0A317PLB1_9HYPH|nr:hypothetical protein [Hoeflea marina]PWW00578.1 hypothetical protein DFR52_103785 [Hoeflea marina]
MCRAISILPLVLTVVLGATPGARADTQNSLLDVWYTALFDVNRVTLAQLLDDAAEIRIEDIGVTQNKTEFLDSMDEWQDIAASANFAWQLDATAPVDASRATALVCYQFPDNEVLIRDVFTFNEGKILKDVQTKIADDCSEF